ncbi:hypothetical protein Mgra_00002474 [Meloidogyne graminicola]|uniref:Uncharacterized protein n=1 Tax=Meloidogyne graminicola TaxID=189291 RepID=A0A8S9ZWH0_9BILA|nr:hypothetical protein Mgra_00002474 [Meloidogyne graminicola]
MYDWQEESMERLEQIILQVKNANLTVRKQFEETETEEKYKRILQRYKYANLYFWLNEATFVLYKNLFFLVSKLELNIKNLFENKENEEKWLQCIKIVKELIPEFMKKLKINLNISKIKILKNKIKSEEKQNKIKIKIKKENEKINEWSNWRNKIRKFVEQTLTVYYNLKNLYGERTIKKYLIIKNNESKQILKIFEILKKKNKFVLIVELIEKLKEIEQKI